MLGGAINLTPSFAFTFASWFSQGLSWLVSAIVLAAIAAAALGGLIWAGGHLSDSAKRALSETKVLVQAERGTTVPALLVLVGGIGSTLAGVFLSKWVGCGVAVAGSIVTYMLDSMAQNSKAKSEKVRWLFAFGAVLPIAAVVVFSIVTGGFGEVDLGMTILAIGASLVGLLGAVCGLVAFWEGTSGDLETQLPEPA